MANVYAINVLKDDTQHAIIKLTAKFDGSGQESNTARIVANTLSGALATNGYLVANNQGGAANTTLPYYGLAIYRLWYDCASSTTADVEITWSATASNTAFMLNGNGTYTCRYTPIFPNKHTVFVTYGGVAIPKAPVKVRILSN